MVGTAIYSFSIGMENGKIDLANVLSRQLPQAINICVRSIQKPAIHEKTLMKFGEEAAMPSNIERFDRILSSLQTLSEE